MDAYRQSDVLLFGNFRLDRPSGGLFRCEINSDPAPVNIGSRALDVLDVLAAHQGVLVSKDEIMAAVWPNTVVEEANLTVQISALRRVLDRDLSGTSCIQTVPGRGYRFVMPVTRLAGNAPPSASVAASEPVPPDPPAIAATRPATPPPISLLMPLNRARLAIAALVTVVAAGGWSIIHKPSDHAPPDDAARPLLSIVVLPFTNLSNDPDQAYFVDAITDDLTTDLSRISGSFVIANSTAQTYRDKTMDVRRIGDELDVRYVLEGSVRRMDDQVTVNAQLLDSRTGAHLWAERFDTDRRNLADAQREITGRLARTLNLQLLEAADRRIGSANDVNPNANDLAMRGWNQWFQPFSIATHLAAELAFRQALEIDPRSVEAKIGLATILVTSVGTGASRSPGQDAAQAESLLLDAIEHDANSSRAHSVLGMLRRIQNRLEESRIEFETAVAFDRNNAHAYLGLGQTLTYLGHPDQAIPSIERAIRLDPRDPNAAFADWALGTCHLLLGHLDKAVDLLRKARAENPRIYYFQLYLAGALGLHGDLDEARAALAEAERLNPAITSMTLWTAAQPWIGNPALLPLRANTLDVGLRRAGMPDR